MIFDVDAFAHGPIESKIWLCDELEQLGLHVNNVYILGAWSGTMSFLLYAKKSVDFNRIINVDLDPVYLAQSRVINNAIECNGQLETLCQDCNTIEYPLTPNNLVINTSTDNIAGSEWYTRIPNGTQIAIQGRTGGHRDCVQPYSTLDEFDRAYPMRWQSVLQHCEFVYPDHSYTRFMKIGIK